MLERYNEKVFIDYIEAKAIELAEKEGIPIIFCSFDEMNKYEIFLNKKAIGKFVYHKDKHTNYDCFEKYRKEIYEKFDVNIVYKDLENLNNILVNSLLCKSKYKNFLTSEECKLLTLVNMYVNNKIPAPIPRIEISEKSDVFILLHELGHYFIYKREQEQSEALANLFIEEFFDNYLPPFFKWIYQNEIKNRCNMDLNFTVDECKEHWKQYCEFRNNFDK